MQVTVSININLKKFVSLHHDVFLGLFSAFFSLSCICISMDTMFPRKIHSICESGSDTLKAFLKNKKMYVFPPSIEPFLKTCDGM